MTEIEGYPEMETIIDFIKEVNIKMHILLAHKNPYIQEKEQQKGLVHWSCKLISEQDKSCVIYFSKGVGIRRWCERPTRGDFGDILPYHVPHDKINKPYDGPMPPFENERDQQIFTSCSQVEPPFLAEVLDVLAKDIWVLEQTAGFEEWAKVLNTSADSRMAKYVFDIVCQQRIQLLELLGEEALHRLVYEIERLHPIKSAEDEESALGSE